MICIKYKPNSQKALFHKDIVNHIRKWIQLLEGLYENNKSVKKILFLHGAVGSGKSVTVECLFKNYNIINIDSDMIRSSDKIRECIESIVSFDTVSLENMLDTKKKDKKNILFVDNIELCEKAIDIFVDYVHNKQDINIPVILICNNSKYQEIFSNNDNCTFLEFKKPSLLEMNKLSTDINKNEKLNLTKDNIKQMIDKSQWDLRQLLFILEQWSLINSVDDKRDHNTKFDLFLESLDFKQTDSDLTDKLANIFDKNINFDIKNIYLLASSEPQTLSCGIYQNYIGNDKNVQKDAKSSCETFDNFVKIIDTISLSNILNAEIYESQTWELYNDYTYFSTVIPSYYVKQNKHIDNSCLVPFKDVSYNFMNSYEEVKKICKQNICSTKLNPSLRTSQLFLSSDNCYLVVPMLIECIKCINEYFDKNKKGKNTTKKEKLDLCDTISGHYKIALDKLILIIYEYKLYEIDIDDFLINKEIYKQDIKSNISKIDLRVFKRILNIFTMDDSHKLFKSHVETSIQYKILEMMIEEIKQDQQSVVNNIYSVDKLTQDISEVWGF